MVTHIVCYLLLLTSNIYSQLIIKNEPWSDDFEYDASGLSGWDIIKTNGYDIPIANPIVNVNNIPKYHGPFPPNYNIQRYFACDTANDARLYASYRLHYCNTDKNDISRMNIEDSLNNNNVLSVEKLIKNNLLSKPYLSAVQNATFNMYFNHSSSTSNIPYCSNSSIQQWYTSTNAITNSVTITGGRMYKFIVEISINGPDEYVLISDVLMSCFEISTLSTNTTMFSTSEHSELQHTDVSIGDIIVFEEERKKPGVFYMYVTLSILSFMAAMLILCCMVFWTTLLLHRKTAKTLKTNPDMADDDELPNKMDSTHSSNSVTDCINLVNIEMTMTECGDNNNDDYNSFCD